MGPISQTMYFWNLLLFSLIFITISATENCRNVSSHQYYELHLATKTSYRTVANINDSVLNFPGCKAKKIWMVVRHGTRNPSARFITQMKTRLPEIRDIILENNESSGTHLRNSDLDKLRKWKTTLEETEEKKLTHEGEEEMIALSERMQARLPDLFSNVYSNTSFFFKFTKSQRTKASAKYFVTGLFGKQTVPDVWFPEPEKEDPILRFYKLCERWKVEIKDNPDTFEEVRRFESSKHMLKAVQVLNKVLKLDNELSMDDLLLIYMACAYETAWNARKKSPWCSVLTNETVQVSEFREDLTYYHQDGYGHELTYLQACPAFKDAIDYFDSTEEFPKATVYFTHSGTLQKLTAHLGLYKDEKHLSHSDFETNQHKWKVSKIDSFGTNLAFVLYDCDGNQKMLTLNQEHIVQLPGCEELCDISVIKKLYSNSINNCTFDEMCAIN